jgi:hypothetical protein
MVCDTDPICTLLVDVGTPPDQFVPLLQNPVGGGLFHVSVCAKDADAHTRMLTSMASSGPATVRSMARDAARSFEGEFAGVL